jgi:hypothetical protein
MAQETPISRTPAPDKVEYPTEPFACPNCGQMLGPSCRVCVACHVPIDFSRVRPSESPAKPSFQPAFELPVRFSWSMFFYVLIVYLVVAEIAYHYLGPAKVQEFVAGAQVSQVVMSLWVLADARRRGVPKPLRWALASLLFWLIFFPWYLERRKRPRAPCPFVESQPGPVTRFILLLLLVMALAALLMFLIHAPLPK